jgi:2,6-dihydroxypseudooxynicotine hydrolase
MKALSLATTLGVHTRDRMLADGLPFPDVRGAENVAADGWFDYWMGRSYEYEQLGDAALLDGHGLTGGDLLWTACMCAHYAQFLWWSDGPVRQAAQDRKVRLYERAAPYLSPPAERIEIPFDDVVLPGYLRLPVDADGPVPCVVLLGGLESTKEESRHFEELCIARGMATFAYDGPGQGEVFAKLPLQPDFERSASAVVDYLLTRAELDGERIGILGRSLGGYYAPRCAAADARFAACVGWGAAFDMTEFDDMPEHTQAGFRYVTGIDDAGAAKAYVQAAIDMADVASQLRCPTYVLHGDQDDIWSMDQVRKLEQAATDARLHLEIVEGGDHCVHKVGHLVRPRMADWLAEQLVGSAR